VVTRERGRKRRKWRTKVVGEVEEEVEVDEAVVEEAEVEVVEAVEDEDEAEAETIMRQTPTKKTKQTNYHRLTMMTA
jgi:hypothetical protein